MHTPTPWTGCTDGIGEKATIVVQRDGLRSIIATCYAGNLCDEHGGSHEDNAALIVNAVNAYEAMVEALQLTRMNALTPQATDWDVVIDRIDRALALAEGKEKP